LKRVTAIIALIFVILLVPALPARADSVTDTLSVYVGYSGGPYYLKTTFHWTELDDMYGGMLPTYQSVYSYFSGSRIAIDSARGFALSDFLQISGVDLSSVARLEFYTKDHSNGAFVSFNKSNLLYVARYYYPNLAVDPETEELIPKNGGELTDGAVQVETMMALEDNWEWDAEGPNFSNPGTGSRFRLLFGQRKPDESLTGASAKYVHAVYCTFSGKPELTTDEPNLKLKLGSDYRVTVNVAAEDSLLNDYVRENLVWSSNNTDAVEVDMYGNLKVKTTGTAEITVTYGETTLTITVTAGDENIDGTGTEGNGKTGDGSGENPGDGGTGGQPGDGSSGDNSGGQQGGAKPAPKPTAQAQQPEPQDGAEQVSFSENSKGVYILSSALMTRTEYAEWVNSILGHDVTTDSNSGGVVNWREGEKGSDASVLQVKINTVSAMPLYIAAGALLVLSGAGEWLSFKIRLGKEQKNSKKRA
jgi:hypothetical protein